MGWRGLGDAVKWFTGLFGLVPCDGCRKRQQWLNKFVPFRFKTLHEKMLDKQNKLWNIDSMSEDRSAFLKMKNRETVMEFFGIFGDRLHRMKMDGIAAMHVIYFEGDDIHCALVPAKPGAKFGASRRERRRIKRDLGREIRDRTRFKKVIWHV